VQRLDSNLALNAEVSGHVFTDQYAEMERIQHSHDFCTMSASDIQPNPV
jgi:hypothetical protein